MSDPPGWVSRYVGLEFEERGRGPAYDCWGLVRLVLWEVFGIAVPSHADGYDDHKDLERLGALIEDGKAAQWAEVAVGEARPGDVLLLRMKGLPIHVAILVAAGWMLHTRKSHNAVLERFEGLAWGRRVLGIYRHAG